MAPYRRTDACATRWFTLEGPVRHGTDIGSSQLAAALVAAALASHHANLLEQIFIGFLYPFHRIHLEKLCAQCQISRAAKWRTQSLASLTYVKGSHGKRGTTRVRQSVRQEHADDGRHHDRTRPCFFRRLDRLHLRLRSPVREAAHDFRLFARRSRDRRADDLPRLCPAPA